MAEQTFNNSVKFTSFRVRGAGEFTATVNDSTLDLPDVDA